MGRRETPVQSKIFKEVGGRLDCRFFRNNVGMATAADGRKIKFGVCNPGGSDLIGFHQRKITIDDIGKPVAIFAALEVKAPGKKPSPAQNNFLLRVKEAGGISGAPKSPAEAMQIIDRWGKNS